MKKVVFLLLLGAGMLRAGAQVTIADSLSYDGVMHKYRLYIPPVSSSSLIIDLHGYSQSSFTEQFYSNFMSVADTAGFLVAYPDGLLDSKGKQYWNNGWPILPNTDDVGYLSELISSLCSQYVIDTNNVFAVGLSNGGFMVHRLACELSNKVTAIASASGGMSLEQYISCSPARAVPVMEIHGTADAVIPYTGISGNASSVDVDSMISFRAALNQCDPVPVVTRLDHNSKTTNGTTVDHFMFSGGTNGASCELYRINGGAHVAWAGRRSVDNHDFNQTAEIWRFFRKYLRTVPNIIPLGINAGNVASQAINVYPNPCTEKVHISSALPAHTVITDVAGRTVMSSGEQSMDVRSLPVGMYFMHIKAGHVLKTEKLLKTGGKK